MAHSGQGADHHGGGWTIQALLGELLSLGELVWRGFFRVDRTSPVNRLEGQPSTGHRY